MSKSKSNDPKRRDFIGPQEVKPEKPRMRNGRLRITDNLSVKVTPRKSKVVFKVEF